MLQTVNEIMSYEEILCDANTLYKAYLASVKSSDWKESTQKIILNYLTYIFKISDDLKNRTLVNDPTDEFSLHERGKIRPITSLTTKDRIVRHALCDEVLLPKVRNKIIYDNGASIKGRSISHARKRFEIHLRKAYREYGANAYILFGDFKKFYDNIIHKIAKTMLLELVDNDEFVEWLLDVIFDGFKVDVSYMSDAEYSSCIYDIFDKLKYRESISKDILIGEKFMEKSVNIGDQISQIIGIFYPHRIDTYVKYVRSQKYYGRYMDDWYMVCDSKEELIDIYENICRIAQELGIHINTKKTRIVKLCSFYKFLQIDYHMTENGKLYKKLNSTRIVNFRRKLKKLALKVIDGSTTYDNVENSFRSWMGAFYKLLTKIQRKNMIKLYEDLFNKHIEIVNKKMVITD